MGIILNKLAKQDKKITALIKGDQLEGEDLLGALQAQSDILAKANQVADQMRGRPLCNDLLQSTKKILTG